MPELTPDQIQRVVAIAGDLARSGDVVQLREFLDHGLAVDAQNPQGDSLLMLAAYHGQMDCVAMLIAAGADVDLRNERDQSPIAGALFKGEDAVVEILREAGADLDAGTPNARDIARMFGRDLN